MEGGLGRGFLAERLKYVLRPGREINQSSEGSEETETLR